MIYAVFYYGLWRNAKPLQQPSPRNLPSNENIFTRRPLASESLFVVL